MQVVVELSEEERIFLLNLLKQKQLNYQAVIKRAEQYDPVAVQRCASALKLVLPLIEKLSSAEKVKKEEADVRQRLDAVEEKVRELGEELKMIKQKISEFMQKVEEKAEVKE